MKTKNLLKLTHSPSEHERARKHTLSLTQLRLARLVKEMRPLQLSRGCPVLSVLTPLRTAECP